jgi:hypothetical protein
VHHFAMMGRRVRSGFDKVDHDVAAYSVQNTWWRYEHIVERRGIVYSRPGSVPTERAQVLCTSETAIQWLPLLRSHRLAIAFLVVGSIAVVACVRVHFGFSRVQQEYFALS